MKQKKLLLLTFRMALLVLAVAGLTACSASKTAYMQNYDMYANLPHPELYQIRIQPFDKLYITAFAEGSEAVIPFNIREGTSLSERNTLTVTSQSRPLEYVVAEDGKVELPLIGRIAAAGKSIDELEKDIEEALLKDQLRTRPVVTVRLKQYTYTLIGEVASPGLFYTDFDKMNIFEALAQGGDMTIHGRRDNVKIIREYGDGTKEIGTIDLNDANVLNSPWFYIQQDDIIYVEPNRAKVRNADVASVSNLWIRAGSIGISLLALIFSIVL